MTLLKSAAYNFEEMLGKPEPSDLEMISDMSPRSYGIYLLFLERGN
jgi:hypothetical protein